MAENTNYYQVLDLAGVQQLWDACKATFVRTVNGQGIDANGNVNVGAGDLTTAQINFVKDEYNKTINLFDKRAIMNGAIYANSGITSGDTEVRCSDYIEIEPSTIYSNNMVGGWSSGSGIAFYDSSKTYISGISSSNANYNQFTTPSNAKYVRISFWVDSSASQYITDVNTLMLNKGAVVLSYQAYNGAVAHQKDIEGVLLWQNATPNSSFASQTINNLPDMSNFKYIVIELKAQNVSNSGTRVFKIKRGIGEYYYFDFIDGDNNTYHRWLYLASSTSIQFDIAKVNTTTNNDYMIPVAIYGSNL